MDKHIKSESLKDKGKGMSVQKLKREEKQQEPIHKEDSCCDKEGMQMKNEVKTVCHKSHTAELYHVEILMENNK